MAANLKGQTLNPRVLKPSNYFPFITDYCYLSYSFTDGKADYSTNLLDDLRSDRDDFGVYRTPLTTQLLAARDYLLAARSRLLQLPLPQSEISEICDIPKQIYTHKLLDIKWPSFEGVNSVSFLTSPKFWAPKLAHYMLASVSELQTKREAQFTYDFLHEITPSDDEMPSLLSEEDSANLEAKFTHNFLPENLSSDDEMPSLMSAEDEAKISALPMVSRPYSSDFHYFNDGDIMPTLMPHRKDQKPRIQPHTVTIQVWRPKAPKAS